MMVTGKVALPFLLLNFYFKEQQSDIKYSQSSCNYSVINEW